MEVSERGTIRVEGLNDAARSSFQMARNARTGPSSVPEDLSPWPKRSFYDEEGSSLFEVIVALPECYRREPR